MTPTNLEELKELAEKFGKPRLVARKLKGQPWGAYFETPPNPETTDMPIMTSEYRPWVDWFVKIHNAAVELVAAAEGPHWTTTPKWSAGTWIGRRATGTTMLFWDGKDETPDLGGNLPTYWFGPLPNPPF